MTDWIDYGTQLSWEQLTQLVAMFQEEYHLGVFEWSPVKVAETGLWLLFYRHS